MSIIHLSKQNKMVDAEHAYDGGVRHWPRWAPYAAVTWSLFYGLLGLSWAVSGSGFIINPGPDTGIMGPLAGRFGPVVAWVIVILAGFPAAIMGTLMLLGKSKLRLLYIFAGAVLSATLLLLMIQFTLLIQVAYIPFVIFELLTGAELGKVFVEGLLQSTGTIAHQLFCLIGGFTWLAATVIYARRSGDACLYCGRREGPEGWNSPQHAARWGRIAVYVAMVAPLFYGITRYAWALGIPLGMTEEYHRQGQVRGEWISGLFLATFSLLGAALMLGLVQRWGEEFPRWIPWLGGRSVPVMLAVIPASIASVLFMVGGIATWSGIDQMAAGAAANKLSILIVVGPLLLFPIWAVALAIATLGYYFRRRSACRICGRGRPVEATKASSKIEQAFPSVD
jgi:hypothetical protein